MIKLIATVTDDTPRGASLLHAALVTVTSPSISISGIGMASVTAQVSEYSASAGSLCVSLACPPPPQDAAAAHALRSSCASVTGMHCIEDAAAVVSAAAQVGCGNSPPPRCSCLTLHLIHSMLHQTGSETVHIPIPALPNGDFEVSALVISPSRQLLHRTSHTLFSVHAPAGSAQAAAAASVKRAQPLQWLSHLPACEFGFKSQNGEDGVLEAIFKRIGLARGRHW